VTAEDSPISRPERSTTEHEPNGPANTVRGRLGVLLLVRNSVQHDARVLRAAHVAQTATARAALILGVASTDTQAGPCAIEQIAVIRLRPWGELPRRLSALRQRLSGRGQEATSVSGTEVGTLIDSGSRGAPPLTRSALFRRRAAGMVFVVQASKVAIRVRPEVVHANDWNTMWAGMAIKLLCGARLIYDSHELWADRNGRWENRRWLTACEALFVRFADEVITSSPGHSQAIARRCHIPAPKVVRNIPSAPPSTSERTSSPSGSQVVYVGGLMPGRGLEQMIDVLALLPEVQLRAIGPGSMTFRAALEQRARTTGVADRLWICDPVPPDAITDAIADAAVGLCLIQPVCRSYELCLPNKLFEYAIAGIPVLASDLPVIAETVRLADIGEIVGPSDPSAIAAGLERLLKADSLACKARNARRFAESQTWEKESLTLAMAYAEKE